jgi:hypothetical protein
MARPPPKADDHTEEIVAAACVMQYILTRGDKPIALFPSTRQRCDLIACLVDIQARSAGIQIQTKISEDPRLKITFSR